MKTNIEIAQEVKAKPIEEIARSVGLDKDDIVQYGKYMAKVPLSALKKFDDRPVGKLILMTAITATPAGEGKTVTTIGLVQALGRLNKRVMGAIREPSLGPTFGLKGGATGGGYSQVYPMWDIDLHFTGDIHAVGAANNLLSAILENNITKKNGLNIDPTRIVLRKALDMNCRELRHIVVGLGGRTEGGTPHESGFIITVATEISAILALATSMADLKERLGKMIVAYTYEGEPVTVTQLGCVGALALLLKDAIFPNLVQTLEGEPFFIHGFPFANIAHGNSSITATKYALKMADIVVTEAGFAADLGAEKFFDIVCRNEGIHADCAVIVCSIRALKMHGGVPVDKVCEKDCDGLRRGILQPGQAHREHPQVRSAFGGGAEPLRLRHRGGDTHRHRSLQGKRDPVCPLGRFLSGRGRRDRTGKTSTGGAGERASQLPFPVRHQAPVEREDQDSGHRDVWRLGCPVRERRGKGDQTDRNVRNEPPASVHGQDPTVPFR